MLRFREHRGGLKESLATQVDVEGMEELVEHCGGILAKCPGCDDGTIQVGPYDSVNIVSSPKFGVIGFYTEVLESPASPAQGQE